MMFFMYRGADNFLTRPDWKKNNWKIVIFRPTRRSLLPRRPTEKKQLKDRHFPSDAQVIAAAETWLDGQTNDFFF